MGVEPDMLKIGIDLDDCITYRPDFFALFTSAMKPVAEIHIITNREQTPASEENTIEELKQLDISYHHLKITGDKPKYILENGITIYFDDTDEYFLKLPETITVFKIREPWNFDFDNSLWLYSDETGKKIDPSCRY